MKTDSIFLRFFKNQAELARILSGGDQTITNRARIKAHRIWNGSKPSDDEINLIYQATNGALDGNYFCGITQPKLTKRRKP